MALTHPSSGGREGQGDKLPGSGGVLASRPPAKIHPERYQGPDDSSIQSRTQGGKVRGTEERKDPQ